MGMTQIKLISISETEPDDFGQVVPTEAESDPIFADVKGAATQSEFAAAGQRGLKPELRFDVWADEYHGEQIVEYDDVRYSIYRTYPANGRVELYTGVKIGENDT